jgi:hypothetical protein
VTEFHSMSFRINGTTYDLNGIDKTQADEQLIVAAVTSMVEMFRHDEEGPDDE